ncbi:RICIN domain-containing protein [Kitasatospora sp. NBC_01300]|uniref:RICIN domain-containing protein n=1 Tax=Kitasatospora sp. NBC_01300 TaxID=2903574 RepID=UPI002F906697|nr:RICIN domain-containing protein [Kitasatospora sp. NBC_01300]
MRGLSRRSHTLAQRAVAGVLLSGLAVAGLMVSPQRAAAADCDGQSSVGGGNCTTALINSIGAMIGGFRSAALQAQADNAAFTQGMASQLSAAAPGYNVMVFKYDGTDLYDTVWFRNVYEANMNGVLVDTTVKLQHHDSQGGPAGYDDFRIWVFAGDSTFTNKGDGGYGNWAFVGSDSDRTVSTTRSCVLIRCVDSKRIIHFPARDITVPGVPKGGGTPITDTPGTPGIPAHDDGDDGDDGNDDGNGNDDGDGGDTSTTPAVPAHQGGGKGGGGKGGSGGGAGVAGLHHPKVKNGRGPVVTGSSILAAAGGAKNSAWQFTALGNGRYKITSAVSGLALTENTKTFFAEAKPWTGADAQKWQLVSAGGGQYQIRITDQDCLTYDEDAKALGVWTCNNAWNQQWKLQ